MEARGFAAVSVGPGVCSPVSVERRGALAYFPAVGQLQQPVALLTCCLASELAADFHDFRGKNRTCRPPEAGSLFSGLKTGCLYCV